MYVKRYGMLKFTCTTDSGTENTQNMYKICTTYTKIVIS